MVQQRFLNWSLVKRNNEWISQNFEPLQLKGENFSSLDGVVIVFESGHLQLLFNKKIVCSSGKGNKIRVEKFTKSTQDMNKSRRSSVYETQPFKQQNCLYIWNSHNASKKTFVETEYRWLIFEHPEKLNQPIEIYISKQMRRMKRLWKGKSIEKGMDNRRQQQARMVQGSDLLKTNIKTSIQQMISIKTKSDQVELFFVQII